MKVTLLTNGPGELWGWVRPVIAELRRRGHSVSLWLLPCQYASGYERAAASGLGADKLEGPGGVMWTWRAIVQEKTDCVVQLGGDLMFGRRLAKRAKTPLLCYSYGFKKGMEAARVFTAYPSMAESIGAKLKAPARVIGDLVKDSLSMDRDEAPAAMSEGGSPRVLCFPGSRPAIMNVALGWGVRTVEHLRTIVPGVRCFTLFSPFTPESELRRWEDAGLNPVRCSPAAAMRAADYALTQPGTNNLEMMHCGLPALVMAPLDFLAAAPISGLARLICGIPVVGPAVKEWKLRSLLARYGGFISPTNRVAGRLIHDEAFGGLTPAGAAELTGSALRDKEKLSRVRGELLELSGESGAASRLCDAIESQGGRELRPSEVN